MSDITPAVQQQLTQALSQLVKAQGDSPIARQAAQVVVQYLGGNQLNLGLDKNTRSISLDKFASLPSALKPGSYTGEIQTTQPGKQGATLALYQANTNSTSQALLAKLNQSQLSAILSAISQDLQPGAQSKSQIVNAKVTNIVGQQVTFSATVNGKAQPVTIRLAQVPSELKIGQSVQLQVIPRGNDWQANLLTTTNTPPNPHGPKHVAEPRTSFTTLNKTPIQLEKSSAVTLLRADLSGTTKTPTANVVSVDKNVLMAAVLKTNISLPHQALEQLTAHATDKDGQRLNITLNTSSSGELRGPQSAPVANIPLTKQQLQQAQTLITESATKHTVASSNTVQNPLTNTSISSPAIVLEQLTNQINKVRDPEKAEQPLLAKDLSKAVKEIVAQLPSAQKNEVLKQINEISRRLLPSTASPSETIEIISKALSDQATLKEPSSKAIADLFLKQINQGIPQGKTTDAEHIKQLLTQPVLNLTPTQIVQPASGGQGLVAGLITLLQVSLASRLARTSAPQSEKIAQIVSTLLGPTVKQTTGQTQRSMNDIQQLDQKHQLIKQLGRLFAQHQSTKLASAEQAMQGQEGLYYILPSGIGENKRDIEILIKRESEKNPGQQVEQGKTAIWHLTMKLDIGDIGQLLTKAKLKDTELELDLYTSNEALKALVYEYLPLFKKRLQHLGIDVSKTLCQLGKIPHHLQSRPYQIFETQA